METHCQTIDNEILDIRERLKRHTINFSTMDQGLTDMHNKVQDMDRQNMRNIHYWLVESVLIVVWY
jgi:hypothetical protein